MAVSMFITSAVCEFLLALSQFSSCFRFKKKKMCEQLCSCPGMKLNLGGSNELYSAP